MVWLTLILICYAYQNCVITIDFHKDLEYDWRGCNCTLQTSINFRKNKKNPISKICLRLSDVCWYYEIVNKFLCFLGYLVTLFTKELKLSHKKAFKSSYRWRQMTVIIVSGSRTASLRFLDYYSILHQFNQ